MRRRVEAFILTQIRGLISPQSLDTFSREEYDNALKQLFTIEMSVGMTADPAACSGATLRDDRVTASP